MTTKDSAVTYLYTNISLKNTYFIQRKLENQESLELECTLEMILAKSYFADMSGMKLFYKYPLITYESCIPHCFTLSSQQP